MFRERVEMQFLLEWCQLLVLGIKLQIWKYLEVYVAGPELDVRSVKLYRRHSGRKSPATQVLV